MTEIATEGLSASPVVLRQFLVQLTGRNAARPGHPKLLWQIAQTHRALGEFEKALYHYRALLEIEAHPEANYLIALLEGGNGGSPLNSCASLAQPFLRFENFLDNAAQAELWQAAKELIPKLHPSVVAENGVVGVNNDTRRSYSDNAGPAIRALFHQRVAELVQRQQVIERLDIQNLESVQDLQISLIRYGDGDFFRPHRDVGETSDNRLRELSFVYHFFRVPRQFGGGELCLFDAGLAKGTSSQVNNFSGFIPVNNSILFFPSRALHEVRAIQCASTDPLDQRFAVVGWALRQDKRH